MKTQQTHNPESLSIPLMASIGLGLVGCLIIAFTVLSMFSHSLGASHNFAGDGGPDFNAAFPVLVKAIAACLLTFIGSGICFYYARSANHSDRTSWIIAQVLNFTPSALAGIGLLSLAVGWLCAAVLVLFVATLVIHNRRR